MLEHLTLICIKDQNQWENNLLKEKTIYDITIQPTGSGSDWKKELNDRIRVESRPLGFYLGHYLKKNKIKGFGFDCLYYRGVLTDFDSIAEIINRNLNIPVEMKDSEYPLVKNPKKVYSYLIDKIYKGNKKIVDKYPLVVQAVEEAIEVFRNNNYEYTWIHKQKRITGVGKTRLVGFINIEKFTLTLEIEYKDGKIISKEILETPPNEYSFSHKFKDILIKDSKVQITNRFNDVWYEFDY